MMADMSKSNAKWDASERAYDRAMRAIVGAGIAAPRGTIDGSGKAGLTFATAEDAARAAKLTGGKVDRGGNGYAANTVVVKP